MTPMTARLAGLSARLREQVASGFFTPGGGSVSFHGKGEMWGGEPIMVARNPDGAAAATAIEDLLASIAALKSALEPFARALADWGDEPAQRDGADLWDHALAMNITLGDVRRAALTLKENDDVG